MAEVEVTWDEYLAFYTQTSAEGRSTDTEGLRTEQASETDAISGATPPYGQPDQGWGMGRRPAISFSYHAAGTYCRWLSQVTGKTYRLPTEAEWEYACRAGTTTVFSTGDNITTEQANYNGTKPYNRGPVGTFRNQTMEVGQFPPNAWGLYDMHGNVSEWCSDVYAPFTPAEQTNPKGPEKGMDRVYRGGNWLEGGVKCRSADRGRASSYEYYHRKLGFRLAKDY